jgi:subunit length determinant Wzz-like protein
MSEPEIDLRRYWSAVAARWWLPVLGLVVGAAIGYALSLGGQDVWRAQALVYLGQPVTPSGAQVQSLATNPAVVGEIVGSAAVQRRVSAQVGMERRELASGTSVTAVKGNVSRLGQNPLVRITVKGNSRFKTAAAANALARIAVDRVSGYADKKISVLKQTIADEELELTRLDESLKGAAGSEAGFLILRRGELSDELLKAREELALAEEVERAKVVENAVARKVTAQSRRNQIVVGAFLGLLLGLAAALAWESAAALRRR